MQIYPVYCSKQGVWLVFFGIFSLMIDTGCGITIPEEELVFTAVRSSGPGGQHVNKTSTTVQLRFAVVVSPSLPEAVRERLLKQQANRVTREGELIINAGTFRSQYRNRMEAIRRLVDCICRAAVVPAIRKATKPSRAAAEKRLAAKRRRSRLKQERHAGD